MKGLRRSWWRVFGLGVVLALFTLGGITRLALDLEHAESCARAEADEQADLRIALWRMDSWLGPLLATEAARPFFEYLPYYPPERAYTRILQTIQPGEVLSPSPLLFFRSDVLSLHFQLASDGQDAGRLTSPQVPEGNLLDLAQATLLDDDELDLRRARLAHLVRRLGPADLESFMCLGELGHANLLAQSASNLGIAFGFFLMTSN